MGRKSKLTPDQWAEVANRLLEGEAERALAREYDVSATAIRKHMEKQGKLPAVKRVAEMIVETTAALQSLPITSQISARNLAAKLVAISNSLASAAEHGAATAHRLNALANSEVGKVDDADPMASLDNLKNVGVLTRLANESASVGLNLLAANRDKIKAIDAAENPDNLAPVFNITVRQ